MVEHLCEFILGVIRPCVESGVRLDYAAGWEDMCFNHGCIISPRMFAEYLVPRYRRITELLKTTEPELVVFEHVSHHQSCAAAAYHHGLVAEIQTACELALVQYVAIVPTVLKKWATGSGIAKKEAMVEAPTFLAHIWT